MGNLEATVPGRMIKSHALSRALLLSLTLLVMAARAAGIRDLEIPADAGQPAILAQLWTPCATPAADIVINRFRTVRGVKDCALPRGRLPLVVISHGMLEDRFSHHDTAEFLADAGFAVVAFDHTQDSRASQGKKSVEDISSFLVRPVDVRRVIDFLLMHPPEGLDVDANRIGFFGFSRGGYTGLVLAGAVPDFDNLIIPCPETYLMCRQIKQHEVPAFGSQYEPRIKSYVIADPVNLFASKSSLRGVKAPIQLWSSELGGMGVRPEDVSAVAANLPVKPDFRRVPGSGHLSFDCPCPPDQVKASNPSIVCVDPPGFDRVEFHRELNTGMLTFFRKTLAVGLVAGVHSASADEIFSKQLAPRTELHPISTLTLTDEQFLKGDAGGKAVTISGQLRIAQGKGRLPLVILQHGSGGYGANVDAWERELNQMGISTFALDGFTGRGLVEVSSNQSLLGRLNFILDIYRALEIAAKHPRVDPNRIVLMGFSRGGQATLYASVKRFHRLWNRSGAEFAAYIPFYPDCMTTYISDGDVADRPIRIFGGTPDDYNPIGVCKPYVERLRAAGHDVEVTEYPNASHAFDNPLGALPAAVSPKSESVRDCRIREDPEGILVNTATDRPFSYNDACVVHGPHTGYDPEATAAARAAVEGFLRTLFKLDDR